MAGVDLRTFQELMGHKTIVMTIRYSHLAPSHQKEAIERLVSTASQSAKLVPTCTTTDTSDFGRDTDDRVESSQVN